MLSGAVVRVDTHTVPELKDRQAFERQRGRWVVIGGLAVDTGDLELLE
jgi:hypothetical protein